MKRLVLIAWLFPLPGFAADNIEEKLDLILEKLETIEKTYSEILQTSEAFKGLFNGGLLSDSVGTEPSVSSGVPDLKSILDDVTKATEKMFTGSESIPLDATGDDYFELVSWSVSERKYSKYDDYGTYLRIKVDYKNKSDKEISIIDGSIVINDKLGEHIVRLPIENDLNLQPNQVFSQEVSWDPSLAWVGDASRLLTIQEKFLDISFDIKKILFEDGTIKQFN